jgi:hypothetical protein
MIVFGFCYVKITQLLFKTIKCKTSLSLRKRKRICNFFSQKFSLKEWTAIAQTIYRSATYWTVRGSNSGRGEIYRTLSYRPCGLPSFLHNGYRVKRPGSGINHPPLSSGKVKERAEPYLFSASLLSRQFTRRNFVLPIFFFFLKR